MTIHAKFFARLREDIGLSECEIEANDVVSALDVWNIATQQKPVPANTLCAINMEYGKLEDTVKDNDEVAFFPPVTGG